MLLRILGATALTLNLASAFKNASPFLLFSTSELPSASQPGPNVASAVEVSSYVQKLLKDCPSDTYIIVNQPSITNGDLTALRVPHLMRRATGKDKHVKTAISIPNVAGSVFDQDLDWFLQKQCGASSLTLDGANQGQFSTQERPQVVTINMPAGDTDLTKSDGYLNTLLWGIPNDKYTVLFTTTPRLSNADLKSQEKAYEMDQPYSGGMHVELKRDLSAYPMASNVSNNLNSSLPLFEKYQFVNAGIFMGIGVTILLLTILYVGISAISGLEVSYQAFSKEMGPAAQKKQKE